MISSLSTKVQFRGSGNDPDFNLGGNGAYFGSENPAVESVACISARPSVLTLMSTCNISNAHLKMEGLKFRSFQQLRCQYWQYWD